MNSKSILRYLLILFMILGVSSCSKSNLDERLIGTWESESAFIVIKRDRTMMMMGKVDGEIKEGPIRTEDGGLLLLLKKPTLWWDEYEIIDFFDYEIINSKKVRISKSLFTRSGGIRVKEGEVPIGEKPKILQKTKLTKDNVKDHLINKYPIDEPSFNNEYKIYINKDGKRSEVRGPKDFTITLEKGEITSKEIVRRQRKLD